MPSMNGVSDQSFSGNRCKIFPLRFPDPANSFNCTHLLHRIHTLDLILWDFKVQTTYVLFHDHSQQSQNNQPNETWSLREFFSFATSDYYVFER